ncbi:MAG: MATE family efflux transporter [Elainellaceae cyanobacterium]
MNSTRRPPLLDEGYRCLRLALPLASAQLAQAATSFVDTVVMGQLGSESLAAGALGAIFYTQLLVVGTSLVSTSSPFIAEAYGAAQPKRAGSWLDQSIWLALAIAVPVTLLMWNAGPLLLLLDQPPAIIDLASGYLKATAAAYPPALLFVALRSFVSALSRPRIVLVITLGGVALNAIADEALALGRWGFPALGLAGIGWSTTVIYWCMTLALLAYVLGQRQFRPYLPLQTLHRPHFNTLWDLVGVSTPVGILAALETGLFTIATVFAGQMGIVVLAAHQIALQTVALTFMVPLGISQAATVRVGQSIGQGDWHTARRAGVVCLGLGSGFMGMMGVLLLAAPRQIVSMYIDLLDPANRDVIAAAVTLLAVGAVFQIVDGLQVIAAGALRGLKDTRIPMVMGAIAYWVIGVPCSYITGFTLGWGGVGLWWGLAVGLAIAAATLTWRFNRLTSRPRSINPWL